MKMAARGFTLIEVLVAVVVFAVMTSLAYSTLDRTLLSVDLLGDRFERLNALQRTVRLMDADLSQMAPRPIRDPVDDSASAALRADAFNDFALELTRTGWNNPAGRNRSNQQRVAYRLEEDVLVRYHWTVLDRTLVEEPVRLELIDGVEGLAVRFLSPNSQWAAEWPPGGPERGSLLSTRPRAVEMTLTLVEEGEIRRLIEVAP